MRLLITIRRLRSLAYGVERSVRRGVLPRRQQCASMPIPEPAGPDDQYLRPAAAADHDNDEDEHVRPTASDHHYNEPPAARDVDLDPTSRHDHDHAGRHEHGRRCAG